MVTVPLPVQAAVGFSHVISALQASGKPVVGHNMLFDVIYVLNIFVADYPGWPAFKAACEHWFKGGVYDTKHITRALDERHPPDAGGGPLFDSTTLGDLYEALVLGKQPPAAAARWRSLLASGCVLHAVRCPCCAHPRAVREVFGMVQGLDAGCGACGRVHAVQRRGGRCVCA